MQTSSMCMAGCQQSWVQVGFFQVKSQVSISNFKSSHKSMDHCIAKSQVLDLIFKSLIIKE